MSSDHRDPDDRFDEDDLDKWDDDDEVFMRFLRVGTWFNVLWSAHPAPTPSPTRPALKRDATVMFGERIPVDVRQHPLKPPLLGQIVWQDLMPPRTYRASRGLRAGAYTSIRIVTAMLKPVDFIVIGPVDWPALSVGFNGSTLLVFSPPLVSRWCRQRILPADSFERLRGAINCWSCPDRGRAL